MLSDLSQAKGFCFLNKNPVYAQYKDLIHFRASPKMFVDFPRINSLDHS